MAMRLLLVFLVAASLLAGCSSEADFPLSASTVNGAS